MHSCSQLASTIKESATARLKYNNIEISTSPGFEKMATGGEEDTPDTADENSFRRKESDTIDLGTHVDDSGVGRSILILPDSSNSISPSYSMVTGLSKKVDHLQLVPSDTPSVASESVRNSDAVLQNEKCSNDEDIRALNFDVEKLRKDYQQLKEELENVQEANYAVISTQRVTIEQLQNKLADQERQNEKLTQLLHEKTKDVDDIKSIYLQMKSSLEECTMEIKFLKQKLNADASKSSQESNSLETTNHAVEEVDGYTQCEADFNSSHLGIGKVYIYSYNKHAIGIM